MTRWLTRAEAAKRVRRSERTIRRWIEQPEGLQVMAGHVREADVVAMDKAMRRRVGRPRKTKGE